MYSAVRNYARSFKQLSKFLKKFYPHINSFADLDINKALMQLRSHLSELGLSIRIYGRRKLSNYENLLNRLFLFYKDFYDTRDEFEKDIWDVRNIPNKRPVKVELKDIENEDIIEWEYIRHNLDAVKMELGYCMKPIKQPCPTQANPCLSCRNFCTTPEFIPQFEMEITEVKNVIERGRALGRQVWIDKNQTTLDRLEPILETLKNGTTHHLAGKKGREYIGKERTHEK